MQDISKKRKWSWSLFTSHWECHLLLHGLFLVSFFLFSVCLLSFDGTLFYDERAYFDQNLNKSRTLSFCQSTYHNINVCSNWETSDCMKDLNTFESHLTSSLSPILFVDIPSFSWCQQNYCNHFSWLYHFWLRNQGRDFLYRFHIQQACLV